MKAYDVVAHSWLSKGESVTTELIWFDDGGHDSALRHTSWHAWDCFLCKLRNGQIIKVRKK